MKVVQGDKSMGYINTLQRMIRDLIAQQAHGSAVDQKLEGSRLDQIRKSEMKTDYSNEEH